MSSRILCLVCRNERTLSDSLSIAETASLLRYVSCVDLYRISKGLSGFSMTELPALTPSLWLTLCSHPFIGSIISKGTLAD